uniref:Ribosomal RNA large subunit methyltransferase K/L-like methyltransferase domain-containing protein n=1 Tax=Ciona intestinalis TaxID=7719 RepID=F6WNV4_CIOIN
MLARLLKHYLPQQRTCSLLHHKMKILDMEKFGGEVTIGATVATGFEFTAVDEITKKIDVVDYDITQGKVFFTATSECFAKIHQLRSVDKLFLVVKRYENYVYDVTKEVELERIGSVAFELPWEQVEKYWNENRPFCIKMNKFQKQKLRERKKKRRQLNLDGCGGGDEEDSDLEVVVDPMCGTGSIPLEGAMEW